MKKLIKLMLVSVIVPLIHAEAQLKTDDKGIFIKSSTPFCTDGLAIIPSADLLLTNVTITRGTQFISWPQYNSITRIYHFSSPVVFRGTMALSYLTSELNGNNPSSLNLAYTATTGSNNYSDYLLPANSTVNTSDQLVTQYFQTSANITDVTAVTSGFVIPPVTTSGSTSFCQGSSVTLSTVNALSWQWYKDGVQIAGATQRQLEVKESGDYSVQTTLANGIATMSDPVSVSVSPAPSGKLISDKGTDISLGDQITLIASGGKHYSWDAIDGTISGMNSDSLIVRPSKTTTYKVIIDNGTGCNTVASLVINVSNDYKALIPFNMVTPNGDGVNDVWIVKNIDLYPNNEVKIIDRSGRIIYSKNGYDNTWDATLNGNPLPEDTYYYILYIDSGKWKLTGFISVVRE